MKKLSKIKKENTYKVPDNYFDEFPAKIQSICIAQQSLLFSVKEKFIPIPFPLGRGRACPVAKRIGGMGFFKPSLRLATVSFSIVVVLLFSYVIINYYISNNTSTTLSTEEISEILEFNSYNIEEELLVEALIQETGFTITDEDFEQTDELIEYLVDYDIDYETLVYELYEI